MSYSLKVSPRAAAQIREAAGWWRENRSKAPEALAEEIERAFDLARRLPSAGERVAHRRLSGVRRILLGRIHYYLYYRISADGEALEILALWHTRRAELPPL